MSRVLTGMEPAKFFEYFEDISAIPRGSYHEEAISNYLKKFAEDNGCTAEQDEYFNLLIRKPASKGYENAKPVIFHGHMDMVLDKEPWVEQDMLTEGVRLKIDGDYIKGDGTTLGADNGVGVAFMMMVLSDPDLPHPPIECIIAVQEEVGKRGGQVFDAKKMNVTGKRLMDFNWHKPDTVFAGCAGDISAYFRIPVDYEDAAADMKFYKLSISGGLGGHSEFDINLERANTMQQFGRLVNLISQKAEIRLTDMAGGVNRYVIPGNMDNIVAVEDAEAVKAVVDEFAAILANEYEIADKDLKVSFEPADKVEKVFSAETTKKVAKALHLLPCGVQSMSLEIPGLVESSNTMAMISMEDGKVAILSTIPSAVTSRKYDILQKMYDLADLMGASVDTFADCPEWPFRPDSKLLATAKNAFKKLYGYEPNVEVSHSSLELGLFCAKIPGLECISLGPKAYDVHTPKERLDWTTVPMVWDHIKEILAELTD